MPDHGLVKLSKFLSLILRHQPDRVGLRLDEEGYVGVQQLLDACAAHGRPTTREDLERVVLGNDKQRFAFSADGERLRASQGHSVVVSLGYESSAPPAVLLSEATLAAPLYEDALPTVITSLKIWVVGRVFIHFF